MARRCPDDLVTAFLEDGTRPSCRRTVCPGDVADDYVPIPPLISTEYPSTKAALVSADAEITTSADYQAWDGEQPLSTGCRFGGSITYTPTDRGCDLKLEACSWSRGLGLTGTGVIDDDAGTFSLKVAQSGADGATVRYVRDAKGRVSVARRAGHVRGSVADGSGGSDDERLGGGGGVDQRRPDGPGGEAASTG